MTVVQLISLASGLVYLVSGSFYVYDVFRRKISPNIVSFLAGLATNVILLTALLAEKSYSSVPFLVAGTTSAVLVCLFSIKKHTIYFGSIDKASLVLNVLGLTIWAATDNAVWVIIVGAFLQSIFFLPIIAKVYKKPELETSLPWNLNLLGAVLAISSITELSALVLLIPIVQLVGSFTVNLLLRKNLKVFSKPSI